MADAVQNPVPASPHPLDATKPVVAGETTSTGTKPVSDAQAEQIAKDNKADAPGQPPIAEVKAESESRKPEADGDYSSQEDLEGLLKPVAPALKDVDRPLPPFHPEVNTPVDEHDDENRPAIDPKEIG